MRRIVFSALLFLGMVGTAGAAPDVSRVSAFDPISGTFKLLKAVDIGGGQFALAIDFTPLPGSSLTVKIKKPNKFVFLGKFTISSLAATSIYDGADTAVDHIIVGIDPAATQFVYFGESLAVTDFAGLHPGTPGGATQTISFDFNAAIFARVTGPGTVIVTVYKAEHTVAP